MTGFDVLRHVREHHRQTSVILITALRLGRDGGRSDEDGRVRLRDQAVQDRRAANDACRRALDYQAAVGERHVYLRKELKNRYRFENIIGTSRKMQHVYNLINKVADTDSTVLIVGESGTGKELVARGLAFQQQPAASSVRGDQLQRAAGKFARVGIVRSQEGRVYRRGRGQARTVRGSESRHDFPRRSEFDGAAVADETAARFAGARSAARRRQQELAGQCARGRRDERTRFSRN